MTDLGPRFLPPSHPDLVYVVGPGDANEELRYSLRSVVANLPHGRLWIVGHRPPWVRAEHLPTERLVTKYATTTANVRLACEDDRISDPFILMNDDFFVMRPVPRLLTCHRGPVADVAAGYEAVFGGSTYLSGMRATEALLHDLGHPEPLSYELHMPLTVHKAEMLRALDVGAHLPVLHKRTAYGNLAGLGGEQVIDCKVDRVHKVWSPHWTFLSTNNRTFRRAVGDHIRSRFPEACGYEEGR